MGDIMKKKFLNILLVLGFSVSAFASLPSLVSCSQDLEDGKIVSVKLIKDGDDGLYRSLYQYTGEYGYSTKNMIIIEEQSEEHLFFTGDYWSVQKINIDLTKSSGDFYNVFGAYTHFEDGSILDMSCDVQF